LSANGKFSRANIDANNAINGNMTTEEGEKYTRRADETRLLIDELMQKKEKELTEVSFRVPKTKAAKPSLFSVEDGSSLNFSTISFSLYKPWL
jgi:hypothetical protein